MSQRRSGTGKIPVRQVLTNELSSEQVRDLRALFDSAWSEKDGEFTDEDWGHSGGGAHFLVGSEGTILSHAAVVRRELHIEDHRLETGYVEAVATWPQHQRRGLATAIMLEVGGYIDRTFELGALNTGIPSFYERLGWVVWQGPTFVRTEAGPVRTPKEDGSVLVRLTPNSPELDWTAPISCEWRVGDVW